MYPLTGTVSGTFSQESDDCSCTASGSVQVFGPLTLRPDDGRFTVLLLQSASSDFFYSCTQKQTVSCGSPAVSGLSFSTGPSDDAGCTTTDDAPLDASRPEEALSLSWSRNCQDNDSTEQASGTFSPQGARARNALRALP